MAKKESLNRLLPECRRGTALGQSHRTAVRIDPTRPYATLVNLAMSGLWVVKSSIENACRSRCPSGLIGIVSYPQ